jgi:hypothetical protein
MNYFLFPSLSFLFFLSVFFFFFSYSFADASLSFDEKENNSEYGTVCTQKEDTFSSLYSPSYSFFRENTSFFKVFCKGEMKTVFIGDENTLIYKNAYYTTEKSPTLTPFPLEGDVYGEWIMGKAKGFFSDGHQKGDIFAYVCEKIEGQWFCGCSQKECKESKWNKVPYKDPPPLLKEGEVSSFDFTDLKLPKEYKDALLLLKEDDTYLYTINKVFVREGDSLVLTGQNFNAKKEETHLLFNNSLFIKGAESVSENSITFIIPPFLKEEKGEIKVQSGNSFSKNTLTLFLQKEESKKPEITKISPLKIKQGELLTIEGKNFKEEGNTVLTGFGSFDYPSTKEGTEIQMVYSPFKDNISFRNERGKKEEQEWKVNISVLHSGGISSSLPLTVVF